MASSPTAQADIARSEVILPSVVKAMSESEMTQELVNGIGASEPVAREHAADEVTDVHRGLGRAEVEALARALVAARIAEKDARCQEAQLNALAELKAWHVIDRESLASLEMIRAEGWNAEQTELIEELLGVRQVAGECHG